MSPVTCHLTTTLCRFSCYERPRRFGDSTAGVSENFESGSMLIPSSELGVGILYSTVGLVSITVSLKCHMSSNSSHSTSYYESKNTWGDQIPLHLTMHFHFSGLMGITMGNKPKNRKSLTKYFLMGLMQI